MVPWYSPFLLPPPSSRPFGGEEGVQLTTFSGQAPFRTRALGSCLIVRSVSAKPVTVFYRGGRRQESGVGTAFPWNHI